MFDGKDVGIDCGLGDEGSNRGREGVVGVMHENIALYTRLGWQETGRGEQAGFQRVFMRKPV